MDSTSILLLRKMVFTEHAGMRIATIAPLETLVMAQAMNDAHVRALTVSYQQSMSFTINLTIVI